MQSHTRLGVVQFCTYKVSHHHRFSQLRKTIASELHDVSSEIDILHWTACSALESIGRSGLGHSFDALEGGKDTALAKALKDLVWVFPITAHQSNFTHG